MLLRSLSAAVKKKARPGVVLMYHRIANTLSDPWKLAVSPENFEEHLKVLKDFHVIPIEELNNALTKKNGMLANTILVTFDDGYRDNYLIGKPLLEKYNIPATFFITTNAIGKQEEFWWDALERICLQSPVLPSKLILQQPENISLDLGKSTNVNLISPLNLYLRLCEIIRNMETSQKQTFIKMLEIWAKNSNVRSEYFTMDKRELLDLQSNEIFTIGAHTMSHPFLPNLSYDDQKSEIQGCIASLENLTRDAPKYLAYPHGGRDQNTLKILAESGVELAFTTDPHYFKADTYKYAIPRFQVSNWDGGTFAFHLNHWMKSNN